MERVAVDRELPPQLGQPAELRRHCAAQRIVIEQQAREPSQKAQLRRQRAAERVVREIEQLDGRGAQAVDAVAATGRGCAGL